MFPTLWQTVRVAYPRPHHIILVKRDIIIAILIPFLKEFKPFSPQLKEVSFYYEDRAILDLSNHVSYSLKKSDSL